MDLGKIFVIFISSIFFFYFIIKKNYFLREIYLDKDFLKPQSFHKTPTPRIGGVLIIIFSIFYLFFFQEKNNFFYSIILLGILFFTIGFFVEILLLWLQERNFWSKIKLLVNLYYWQNSQN